MKTRTFRWRTRDVLFHEFCDVIVQDNGVQGPAFVSSGDLLSHGSQEALWVEEASHPEDSGAAVEHPAAELGVAVQEVCEPETQGGRFPGNL